MGVYSPSAAALTNPYKFSAYRNAAANTGNAAFAQVVFDTELFDTGGNFASGTFTAPVAGFYHFDSGLNVTTGTTNIIAIYKNGAELHRGVQAGITGIQVSALVQLAINDTVDIRAYGNAANALFVGSSPFCYFSGYLVSIT